MAEFDPLEERSLLYVLGELPREKASAFEVELEAAPEWMQRVRELEEGAAMLALACPPKRAPKATWTDIESAIEADMTIVIPWEWFRIKAGPQRLRALQVG